MGAGPQRFACCRGRARARAAWAVLLAVEVADRVDGRSHIGFRACEVCDRSSTRTDSRSVHPRLIKRRRPQVPRTPAHTANANRPHPRPPALVARHAFGSLESAVCTHAYHAVRSREGSELRVLAGKERLTCLCHKRQLLLFTAFGAATRRKRSVSWSSSTTLKIRT
eukprot:6186914-Pleurochrysis_carterae.AAC.3